MPTTCKAALLKAMVGASPTTVSTQDTSLLIDTYVRIMPVFVQVFVAKPREKA